MLRPVGCVALHDALCFFCVLTPCDSLRGLPSSIVVSKKTKNEMFKNFTIAVGEKWCENWWPQGGNHTPREDEVEEVEKCRLSQREIGF